MTITATSFGRGCVPQGETDVSVVDLQAVLRPYRYQATIPGLVCTDELRLFQHVATVQFAATGHAQVRMVGEQLPGNGPVEIVRPLVVVP